MSREEAAVAAVELSESMEKFNVVFLEGMKKLEKKIDNRLDEVTDRLDEFTDRFDELEKRVAGVEQRQVIIAEETVVSPPAVATAGQSTPQLPSSPAGVDKYKSLIPNSALLHNEVLYDQWVAIKNIPDVKKKAKPFLHSYFKLLHFMQTYGHSDVPNSAEYRSLWNWIKNQRNSMRLYETDQGGSTIFHRFPDLYDFLIAADVESGNDENVVRQFRAVTNREHEL